MAQLVKNLPAVRETWVWSLGWEDPLEKGKAAHSSILAWRIPWTIWSMASQRVGHDWATFTFYIAIEWVSEWSCSVVSDSLRSHGLWPARLFCPWDSPGKNTGVGFHFLLQQSANYRMGMSQNSETGTRPFTHNMHFEITLAHGESSQAIKLLTWVLKKGRFPSRYIVSLT